MEPNETLFTSAPVTVAIGNVGAQIYFDADPTDGTIALIADEGANLEFDAYEFGLLAELLILAAEGA
jgi:hypothetical protein